MKLIEGFDNYYVDKEGRIYGTNYKKYLKPSLTSDGYLQIQLQKNTKKYTFLVHRLVALCYISNPDKKPTVNHKDKNRQNNNLENLEWATFSEQNIHKKQLTRKL